MKMTLEQLEKKIGKWKKKFPNIVLRALSIGASLVVKQAQEKHLSGRPGLKVGTGKGGGRLRRSMTSLVKKSGKKITAKVGTNVIYGRIHEYGGDIYPRTKPWLVFKIGNQWIMTKHVKIPERPYLRPSIREKKSRVMELIAQHLVQGYERGG